ncbi:relaxase/mobilization nuclease domain-containing protein [Acinetobacter indicus]|uniref:relaxase/mobilization nuclease domain-containing protein n=1 Tax=Acinetobacter indicus TaxID=756892 RepID=UPI00257581E6|nr:relaxase/mobilization nuclease domain-containing protein [Acinetobacter indicus]MDM1493787.1 relaxase/mobilization nuclease domain-containing protein [Acinetobacter indicus]
MIVKFFKFGKGNSKSCIDYLLGADRDREHARVLSGDVELTSAIIDSSRFTKKYTSGCLSFAEADLPEADKKKIMADYEACLFPGMAKDHYNILWIEHRDKGRLELNFVIPNVELSTGKRLQPFYAPADMGRVDCFKKIINHDYNLHDPDDPENRQLSSVQLNEDGEIEAKKKGVGKSQTADEIANTVDTLVMQAYLDGKIKDRDDTILFLTDELKLNVSRVTKGSISISLSDRKRPIRLKGEMYERDFSVNRADSEEEARRADSYRERISRDITAVKAEYRDRIESKTTALAERYRSIEQTHSAENRLVATTTYRADQSIQQLYETAINKSSRSAWNIDDSFSGLRFDAVYLEWQASKSNRKKCDSVEATADSNTKQSLSNTIEIENERTRRIIANHREAITIYSTMSCFAETSELCNSIATANNSAATTQNNATRTAIRDSIDATATALEDATRSEQQFKRNIEHVDQNTTTLRRYVKSSEEISAQQTIQQETDVPTAPARKVENKRNDDDYSNDFSL